MYNQHIVNHGQGIHWWHWFWPTTYDFEILWKNWKKKNFFWKITGNQSCSRLLGRYARRYDLYVSYGGRRGQPVAFARKAPNILWFLYIDVNMSIDSFGLSTDWSGNFSHHTFPHIVFSLILTWFARFDWYRCMLGNISSRHTQIGPVRVSVNMTSSTEGTNLGRMAVDLMTSWVSLQVKFHSALVASPPPVDKTNEANILYAMFIAMKTLSLNCAGLQMS